MSCIKGSNPFVSAKQSGHPCGGFFVAFFWRILAYFWLQLSPAQSHYKESATLF